MKKPRLNGCRKKRTNLANATLLANETVVAEPVTDVAMQSEPVSNVGQTEEDLAVVVQTEEDLTVVHTDSVLDVLVQSDSVLDDVVPSDSVLDAAVRTEAVLELNLSSVEVSTEDEQELVFDVCLGCDLWRPSATDAKKTKSMRVFCVVCRHNQVVRRRENRGQRKKLCERLLFLV